MRKIDVPSWPRRDQYELFRDSHLPYFNVCADVDVTATQGAAKARGVPVTAAIVYLIARTANRIREFRYRMRGESVVEHDLVHPASTVLTDGDLFSFCFYEYHDDFSAFVDGYRAATARAQAHPSLEDPENRDDLLFMTAIPWVSFTSFSHPVLSIPADSIPRFAWGRFYERNRSVMMPLSVQGHHALIDGLHVGRYFQYYQDFLLNPDDYMTA